MDTYISGCCGAAIIKDWISVPGTAYKFRSATCSTCGKPCGEVRVEDWSQRQQTNDLQEMADFEARECRRLLTQICLAPVENRKLFVEQAGIKLADYITRLYAPVNAYNITEGIE